MEASSEIHDFQPTLLGMIVRIQDAGVGMVTNETPTDLFIESDGFTGWISKAEFWEAWGVEE
jgi:hypothetical protein